MSNNNIYLLGLLGNTIDSLLLAFALAEKVRMTNAENVDLTQNLEKKVSNLKPYELNIKRKEGDKGEEGQRREGVFCGETD